MTTGELVRKSEGEARRFAYIIENLPPISDLDESAVHYRPLAWPAMSSMDENESTVEELIQIQLTMIEAAIYAVGEPPAYYLDHRQRVAALLSQLRSGSIAPEYAKIELRKLDDEFERWQAERNRQFKAENPDFPWT